MKALTKSLELSEKMVESIGAYGFESLYQAGSKLVDLAANSLQVSFLTFIN